MNKFALIITNEFEKKICLVSMNANMDIIHSNIGKTFQADMSLHVHILDYEERIFSKCGCDGRVPPMMILDIGDVKIIYRAFDELDDKDLRAVIDSEEKFLRRKEVYYKNKGYHFALIPNTLGEAKIPNDIYDEDKGCITYPLCVLEIKKFD